jgi:hypothetical protein
MTDEFDEVRVKHEWRAVADRAAPLFTLWSHGFDSRYPARRAARGMGLSGAGALSEWLRTQALPPYGMLRDWYLLTRLVDEASAVGLNSWSWAHGREPAQYYRFVRRVSRYTWSELRALGAVRARQVALAVWEPWTQTRE